MKEPVTLFRGTIFCLIWKLLIVDLRSKCKPVTSSSTKRNLIVAKLLTGSLVMLQYGTKNWRFLILGNIFPTVRATCHRYWETWIKTNIVRIVKRRHHRRSKKVTCSLTGGSRIKFLLDRDNRMSESAKLFLSSLKMYQFSNVTKNRDI